jgi:lipopolysaccharide transport system permease protein
MLRNIYELIRYRALIFALVTRHVRSRYRGSVLGFVWSFLNPLCLIAVYTLVFRNYIRFETESSYPLFLLTGLLPWIWFNSGIIEATASISSGGNLITKAMFPPQILPTVAALTNLVNYLFALPVLLVFLLWNGKIPGLAIAFLPVLISLQLIFVLGLSYLFSALNVFYRDVQHVLGNLFSLLFFLTPVIYPISTVPEKHQKLMLFLNPLSYLMEMYRGVVLDNKFPELFPLLWVSAVAIVVFLIGNLVFNRNRESFAEYV